MPIFFLKSFIPSLCASWSVQIGNRQKYSHSSGIGISFKLSSSMPWFNFKLNLSTITIFSGCDAVFCNKTTFVSTFDYDDLHGVPSDGRNAFMVYLNRSFNNYKSKPTLFGPVRNNLKKTGLEIPSHRVYR